MKPQFFGADNEVLLESDFDIDRLVVFLPGMSGKAHSARFKPLATAAVEVGAGCARLNLWEDTKQLERMTVSNILDRIDAVFSELTSRGYSEVILVGKSFGGGVGLQYQHPLIVHKVLWAPAIGVVEGEGNTVECNTRPLGTFDSALDITLGTEDLMSMQTPLTIIHGTADTVVPVRNSEQIIAAVPKGILELVIDADHSFKGSEHEHELIRITQDLVR